MNERKNSKRIIHLVGMGPGAPEKLTAETIIILKKAELIAGSVRMLEQARKVVQDLDEKTTLASFRNEEIIQFIEDHPECTNIAILYSGNVGRYSGAESMRRRLMQEYMTFDLKMIPGISASTEFLTKLGISEKDVLVESVHGRDVRLIPLIKIHRYVLVFLGEGDTVTETAKKLMEYGMNLVRITVGLRLSYPEEEIRVGSPREFVEQPVTGLAIALFENPEARAEPKSYGIPDEEFIRGKVPMTKRDVRMLSLSRLELEEDSIVYDVGAGTGSVSVEIGQHIPYGTVYAIERDEGALALLEENRKKFSVDNMEIIRGEAPQALEELPDPDAVFIGGSGGNLGAIIEAVLAKTPFAPIVINTITLESMALMVELKEQFRDNYDFEITEFSVTHLAETGSVHMRRPDTPVMIIKIKAREGRQNGRDDR